MITRYFSKLSIGKAVLWCYLIWYLSTVFHHFDPSLAIWLNSAGISAFIGIALILSVGNIKTAISNKWQTFRLFMMPFGVSSFSSLIKGRHFFLIFPPSASEMLTSAALCFCFIAWLLILKSTKR